MSSFEDELLFTTDYIIERFQKNHFFMEFIAKNLSWGIFKSVFTNGDPSFSSQFYDHYMTALKKYNVNCPAPELLLFTMIELIGSTVITVSITASLSVWKNICRICTDHCITYYLHLQNNYRNIYHRHLQNNYHNIYRRQSQNSYHRRYHWHPQNSYRGDIVSAHIHG